MEDDGNLPNVNPSTTISSPPSNPNPNSHHHHHGHPDNHHHPNKEQDRFLPIANVGRIMKKAIPANGKISKDAKETVQECVSEFISFVTGEASDKCLREKRKTINGDDIIWAITTLGFEDYVAPLKTYLGKYREIEDEKVNNVPKQQQQRMVDQRIPGQGELSSDPHSLGGYSVGGIYPPAHFLPHHHNQAPFLGPDQAFGLPFPAGSIPTQDQIDSGGGHW
ncbi:nuclear transcription factor Y subunit B-3 [Punica granatum]|uniref:Nuclear transcription factor Y subunit B-3 n=2 Tax=Punica granatum TaxID=22663 RepID=A0A6P8E7G9_PUNGR|nr:nuclear transcription factor Y subunit B-3 [Punica granatum]PKI34159.1 hypothetical protein CRG98_045438 [Punica granatum]